MKSLVSTIILVILGIFFLWLILARFVVYQEGLTKPAGYWPVAGSYALISFDGNSYRLIKILPNTDEYYLVYANTKIGEIGDKLLKGHGYNGAYQFFKNQFWPKVKWDNHRNQIK